MPPKSNNEKVYQKSFWSDAVLQVHLITEEGGWGRRARQADQAAGQRRQVRQAEEGGAEEQEGCRQGEEVRLVDTGPSFSIKIMWKLKTATGWLIFGLNTKRE